jgi:ADP-ribose 1''-phosphate phosphatase
MSKLTYITSDLFQAPPGSILLHACNTLGSWGAGIALSFRHNHPSAFHTYQNHCKQAKDEGTDLVGTCLLIRGSGEERGHDVACLFTSRGYGRRKDTPGEILEATRSAVKDLMRQNEEGKALHAW